MTLEFDLQRDDELVHRADGLTRFDALTSSELTPHENYGQHTELPRLAIDDAVQSFTRHLGAVKLTSSSPGCST